MVSSDSDFTALANRIREQGLEVIGIGEDKTPASLRNVCNRFIFVENLSDDSAATNEGQQTKAGKRSPKEAVPLMTRAMDEIVQDNEWCSLSALGKQIIAANPDFDPRTYGCKKLSELVKKLHTFELQTIGKTLSVRPRTASSIERTKSKSI